MAIKPYRPVTEEEVEAADLASRERILARIHRKEPRVMALIEQGKHLCMSRVIPPEVWATDPRVIGERVEEPRRNAMVTPPVPDSDLPE